MVDRRRLIVADSSALVSLAVCDALGWLSALFETVRVPPAVFQEISTSNKLRAATLREYLRDKIEPVEAREGILEMGSLGQGELEAMALYHQLRGSRRQPSPNSPGKYCIAEVSGRDAA